jgi:DNA-binding transcriptional LysR family regulator
MQIESLRVFCDVARHRSFSQAAQANHLTQSAASQAIMQLEKHLDVQLVNRATRPLQLTPLGQLFYNGCKQLVEQYEELEASIRKAHKELTSTVRVAAIYSVGLGDMGQYIEQFAEQQPNVKVQVEYLHPDQVYARVLEGTVDFGLVSFPRKSRELASQPWREEEMVLACSPGHVLAQSHAIRPEQLAGEKFIGFTRELVIRREVDRFLREQGVGVVLALEFDNIENIKKAIEVGAGVALLPEPTLRREVEAGTLLARPLFGCRLVRPLGIISRRHQKLSSTALRFIDLLLRKPEEALGNGKPALDNGASPPRDEARRSPSRNGSHRGSRRTK